jgi:hypothetical protein
MCVIYRKTSWWASHFHYHIPQDQIKKEWYTADYLHFASVVPDEDKSADLTLVIWLVIPKRRAGNWSILKNGNRIQHFKKLKPSLKTSDIAYMLFCPHQYKNIPSTHWNHQNILLISWDYPFKFSFWRKRYQEWNSANILQKKNVPILCVSFKIYNGVRFVGTSRFFFPEPPTKWCVLHSFYICRFSDFSYGQDRR